LENATLFPGNRRRIEMLDYDPLLSAQVEKRFRLDLLMPLTGQSLIGMPEWIAPFWENMEKEGSAGKDVDLAIEIEGVTFEGFSTEGSKRNIEIETGGLDLTKEEMGSRHVLIPGSTLRNFKLVRVTRDKQNIVALSFCMTVKGDVGLAVWCYTYHGATFWASFTVTQAKIEHPETPNPQMKLGEVQSPAQAKKAAEEFFDKGEKAAADSEQLTKEAQEAVTEQSVEEQAKELATAGGGKKKPN
jgi:hypothetical protein